jgi:iron complex transport system substrate-binding protein
MYKALFIFALCAFFIFTLLAHRALDHLSAAPPLPDVPQRIVSLAPSITETLYALGMGPGIVGVTRFCAYPADVKSKARVAGFSDVNYEAVLGLTPDMVVLPLDKTGNRLQLERLGLPVLALDILSISGLMTSIETLGQVTKRQREARVLLERIRDSLDSIRERGKDRPRPRVLFSIMHSYQGLGYITEINAVGRDSFYNEMIELAGGVNVYQGSLDFPRLSREALIFLNPEVIIDVIPTAEDEDAIRRDWESLSSVSAIRNGRLHLFMDAADTVPGPRFYQTLRKLSLAFHPAGMDRAGR